MPENQTDDVPTALGAIDQSQEALVHTTRTKRTLLSDQIHILGNDAHGRFMAHTLSNRENTPPVRLFLHNHGIKRKWDQAGRCIHLLRDNEHIPTRRVIAEQVKNQDFLAKDAISYGDADHINQLVITVPACSVLQAFSSISHRVTSQTTILLAQDGLGVAEALNSAYFPDPMSRPIYVLGHMTHKLYPVPDNSFAVAQTKPGRLYMAAFRRDMKQAATIHHPPVERLSRPQHFLQLLTTTPELRAGGFPVDKFLLRFKLPDTVFHSVMDPLTVILDCKYDKLIDNTYAKQLMDELLGEIVNVISRLPELRGSLLLNGLRDGEFRNDIFSRLGRMRDSDSRMRFLTQKGFKNDIDFLNGYFVRRGRDVGVRCPANETIMWMVKAKYTEAMSQRREAIPFQE
jgi:ketopantoate reductase